MLCVLKIIIYIFLIADIGGVLEWQNVIFAERALSLDRTSLTPTVRPTECGSPTFARLEPLLTELIPPCTYAPDACALARLPAFESKYEKAGSPAFLF